MVRRQAAEIDSSTSTTRASAPNRSARTASLYRPMRGNRDRQSERARRGSRAGEDSNPLEHNGNASAPVKEQGGEERRHERHDPLFEMGAFRQFMQLTAAFLAGRGSAPVCVRRRLDAMSRHPRSEKRARRTQTRVVRILDNGRQRECRPRSMRKPCLSSWRCLQKLNSGWERSERRPGIAEAAVR